MTDKNNIQKQITTSNNINIELVNINNLSDLLADIMQRQDQIWNTMAVAVKVDEFLSNFNSRLANLEGKKQTSYNIKVGFDTTLNTNKGQGGEQNE